jgi:hypothetical protein
MSDSPPRISCSSLADEDAYRHPGELRRDEAEGGLVDVAPLRNVGSSAPDLRVMRRHDIIQKQTSRQHKRHLYVWALPLRAGWALGCLYLAGYGGWAWFFRSSVDSWARRVIGRRLGLQVIWLPATTFPLEIWVWGRAGRAGTRGASRLESRLALGCAALCLSGAFMPTAALCLLLRWGPRVSAELGPALYLTTPLLILLFVASHLKWRAPDPSEPRASGVRWGP